MTLATVNTLIKRKHMESIVDRRAKSMGYRAGRLHRLHMLALDGWLEELGLPGVRYGTVPFLSAILERDGRTQDELAAWASVSCARAARALCMLEDSGLITRDENPENRRQKLVYATEKAHAVNEAFIEILSRNNATLLKGFSDDERALALEFMDRMIANLEGELAGETE